MITLLLLVRATYTYGVVLHAHPVRGESHNQRNTTGEVATVPCSNQFSIIGFAHEMTPNLATLIEVTALDFLHFDVGQIAWCIYCNSLADVCMISKT